MKRWWRSRNIEGGPERREEHKYKMKDFWRKEFEEEEKENKRTGRIARPFTDEERKNRIRKFWIWVRRNNITETLKKHWWYENLKLGKVKRRKPRKYE
ncbi:hypothetical protein WDU94_003357 [Cyamophila willieti]